MSSHKFADAFPRTDIISRHHAVFYSALKIPQLSHVNDDRLHPRQYHRIAGTALQVLQSTINGTPFFPQFTRQRRIHLHVLWIPPVTNHSASPR